MVEAEVISIKREGFFEKSQVDNLIRIVLRITEKYHSKVEKIISDMDKVTSDDPILVDLEEEMNELIKDWHFKVKKLGGLTKGLWLVDFDNGEGYFCWKYPEKTIEFVHGYQGQYKNRKKIVDSEMLTL